MVGEAADPSLCLVVVGVDHLLLVEVVVVCLPSLRVPEGEGRQVCYLREGEAVVRR